MTEIQRREFVLSLARRCLGVSLLPAGGAAALGATPAAPTATAKSVIYVFLTGGMSHLDTLDPKPDNPGVQGPIGTIATPLAGVRFGEVLPGLAKRINRFALVRSVTHNQGNHEPGQYKVRTGYEQRPDLIHPSLGAWAMRLRGAARPDLPGYVRVGGLGGHPASGFFDVKYAPLPLAKADGGLQNGTPRPGLTRDDLAKRLALAADLDRPFTDAYPQPAVKAYADLYADALRLMAGKDVAAFDIGREPPATRERYGKDSPFAGGCILARRLVEAGVRFVEVDQGGWDSHVDNAKVVRERAADLDRALGALLDDLSERGLLSSTLVAVVTEFGRTAEIDRNAGRNHWPLAYSCLLAGGGVRGGQVYGQTDKDGMRVRRDPVTVPDLNATVARALGLPLVEAFAPGAGGQKFTVTGKDTEPVKGTPVGALFG